MDTRDSFKIEGWEAGQTFAPISHRHQLRGLQNIISKTKNNRQIRFERLTRRETKEDSSFFSLKSHKKCYTQEIPKEKNGVNSERSPEIVVPDHSGKTMKKKELSLDCFRKTREAGHIFKNIVALMEKEPSIGSPHHFKNITANIARLTKKSRSYQQIAEGKQKEVRSLKSKIKPKKMKIQLNSPDCLVIQPNLEKDQKMRELKAFFLKTIKGMEGNRTKTLQETREKKKEDYRWKKIVGKTHRRKKDLEQLFRTRPIFKKRAVTEIKEVKQWIPKPMPSQLSLLKDEFDDDNIYCPWSYKEDRLTEHFKSKQKQ